MAYTFNKQDILDRIEEIKPNQYDIKYSVSTELREDLDMLIEQDIGTEGFAILYDCNETEENGTITGYITLVFSEDVNTEDKEDYLFKCASQFDMLSKGEPLSA